MRETKLALHAPDGIPGWPGELTADATHVDVTATHVYWHVDVRERGQWIETTTQYDTAELAMLAAKERAAKQNAGPVRIVERHMTVHDTLSAVLIPHLNIKVVRADELIGGQP